MFSSAQPARRCPAVSCSRSCANDVLSYQTPRLARIKDWRLGALSLLLTVSALIYIVVFTIIIQQRYRLRAVDLSGSVRLQLRAPAPAFRSAPGSSAYCAELPCRYLDQYDAVPLSLEAGAIFLSTRVGVQNFTSNASAVCGGAQLQPSCDYAAAAAPELFYVAGAELFTLLIDHGFSTELGIGAAAANISGSIVDVSGTVLDPCADYSARGFACDTGVKVGRVGLGPDILPMATVLRAAGISSLDDPLPGLEESMRSSGVLLLLTIEYSNYVTGTLSYSENVITYQYKVAQVPGVEFKAEQVLPEPGVGTAPSRVIVNRHGIRLVVKQSGNIGKFDFATLIISLTASLGLLAVVTLVVDCLATRVLPFRAIYQGYKVYDSVDFSDLAHLGRAELARIRSEDLVNPQPTFLQAIPSIAASRSSRVLAIQQKTAARAGATGVELAPATPAGTVAAPNPLHTALGKA